MSPSENLLMRSYLSFGNFALFNPPASSRRKVINRLIKLLLFFDALKILVIVLAEWLGHPEMKLYLVEMLLFDKNQQKYFDVGVTILQIGTFFGFSYWAKLNENKSLLKSFDFLTVPENPSQYQQLCLDRQLANEFLKMYRFFGSFLNCSVVAYYFSILAAISRCLYHTFNTVSLAFFLSGSLLLVMINLISYLLVDIYINSKVVTFFLTAKFLILRLKTIDGLIRKSFAKLTSTSKPGKFKKQRAKTLEILCLLNDFCRQFKNTNAVLDSGISPFIFGSYFVCFTSPYFLLFTENPLTIRFLSFAMVMVGYLFFLSFSLCNDTLQREVGL